MHNNFILVCLSVLIVACAVLGSNIEHMKTKDPCKNNQPTSVGVHPNIHMICDSSYTNRDECCIKNDKDVYVPKCEKIPVMFHNFLKTKGTKVNVKNGCNHGTQGRCEWSDNKCVNKLEN